MANYLKGAARRLSNDMAMDRPVVTLTAVVQAQLLTEDGDAIDKARAQLRGCLEKEGYNPTIIGGPAGDWSPGDFVSWRADDRFVGRSYPGSKPGVVDVDWEEQGTKSTDVPVGELKLARRARFTILISDWQREQLMDALNICLRKEGHYETALGSGQIDEQSERQEMEMLVQMLGILPEEDAKASSGLIHGLCL